MSARKPKNYINNRTLYERTIEYKGKLQAAKDSGTRLPQVPNYIGESILKICSNLAKKPNFSGYTPQYKQEMISDAVLDCVSAVDNFDPAKTSNPFAYFTQIAWNAFIRRIQKEKKQVYIKHKNYENLYMSTSLADENPSQLKSNEFRSEVISSFEDKAARDKAKQLTPGRKVIRMRRSKTQGVEKFVKE